MKNSIKVAIVVVVVVILVVAGVAIYGYYHSQSTKTQPAKNTLTVEEGSYPDSFDPAVTYSTPGWEIMNQVYQGLVAPNGTSETSFVGVLASNWTVSSDGMNYTFYLRQNVTFSNGDPFNAYVMWYSIYRTIIMNQAPEWILGQNLASNGTGFNVTDSLLNSTNYTSPNSTDLAILENANQSVQVVNANEIIIHLGYGYDGYLPYNAFLMTLTTPMTAAVDPIVINAHGGVVANSPNSWTETNAVGTGFYEIFSVTSGQSITLVENPSYWAKSIPQSQWNSAIQPPYIKYIVLEYKSLASRISDLKSGSAQIIEAPVQEYTTLKGIANVNVSVLPIKFGSSEGAYYVYMDPLAYQPFQNIDVRMAITYAIDYQGIISSVFDSYATQWVGPIPPGFQYYNQSNQGLQYYQYNGTLAAQYLAKAGYQATLPNGTILNKSAPKFGPVNFLYTSDSTSETSAAQIIQHDLASIGIAVNLVSLTFPAYEGVVWSGGTNSTSYPMGINFYTEDYTASIDYVSALTTNYIGTSDYNNSTVFNWTVNASTSFDEQYVIQNFTNITQAMYDQYYMPWLYVPYFLSINLDDVTGMIPNAAGSGAGYFMFYNTVHYAS